MKIQTLPNRIRPVMVGSRIGFTLDLSTHAKNGLRLIMVCVEVKFWGLFMDFFFSERREGEEEKMGNYI